MPAGGGGGGITQYPPTRHSTADTPPAGRFCSAGLETGAQPANPRDRRFSSPRSPRPFIPRAHTDLPRCGGCPRAGAGGGRRGPRRPRAAPRSEARLGAAGPGGGGKAGRGPRVCRQEAGPGRAGGESPCFPFPPPARPGPAAGRVPGFGATHPGAVVAHHHLPAQSVHPCAPLSPHRHRHKPGRRQPGRRRPNRRRRAPPPARPPCRPPRAHAGNRQRRPPPNQRGDTPPHRPAPPRPPPLPWRRRRPRSPAAFPRPPQAAPLPGPAAGAHPSQMIGFFFFFSFRVSPMPRRGRASGGEGVSPSSPRLLVQTGRQTDRDFLYRRRRACRRCSGSRGREPGRSRVPRLPRRAGRRPGGCLPVSLRGEGLPARSSHTFPSPAACAAAGLPASSPCTEQN